MVLRIVSDHLHAHLAAHAIARMRLAAVDLVLGVGVSDLPQAARAAVESVADMTDVDSAFVRAYAAALLGMATGADREDVARAARDLERVAYVNRGAVREVQAWLRRR